MGVDGTSSATRDDGPPAIATGDDGERRAEQAAQTQAGTYDSRSQPRAETLTREQYADVMRANGSPVSRDNSPDDREAPEGGPPNPPEGRTSRTADHDRAEPRDRETYADDVRTGHSAGDHQGPAATPADLNVGTTLNPASASNADRADRPPEDHSAAWQQAAETPILTENDSAGTSHGPDQNELVNSDEHPRDDQRGDRIPGADQAATLAQDQRGAGHQPETITFENKEIEVTHNAADGLWIEGLPGEPPARIGDLISSPEESGRNRIENFREELTKDADDIIDMGGKWTDLLRDSFGTPPPTNSMTHSRLPEIAAVSPEHGINAGHGAEALLTLAIVGAAAVHKLHERWRGAWEH
jgi:hypothetical protein